MDMLEHILSCTLILNETTEANKPYFQPSPKPNLHLHSVAQAKAQVWKEKRIATVAHNRVSKQVLMIIVCFFFL